MRPPHITPYSNHYALKYHWFRAHIGPNHIENKPISGEFNPGGIMTKALRVREHLRERNMLMNRVSVALYCA